jgi:hypothetical protein
LVDALGAMLPGANAFAIEGGASTFTLADAVAPVPPSVDVTAEVTLFWAPAVVPVTLTEKVQLTPAANTAPERLSELAPAVAVMVPPPQDPVSPLGVEIKRPEGRVSVKPIPCSVVAALLFNRVKLREVELPTAMLAAPNDLLMVGGDTTVRLALAVFPVPPLVEVTWTLLFNVPAELPFTLTETAHVPLVASEPPARLTEPAPAVAVTVPPQVLVALGVAATTIPLGNVSLNAKPVNARLALGLVMLNVTVLVPPSATEVGLKLLEIEGAVPTLRLAVAVFPVPPLVEVTFPVVLV